MRRILITAISAAGIASAGGQDKFRAKLTGDAAVPPVMTDKEGDFRLAYDDFEGRASYRIKLNDGSRIFMAHIHCGDEESNGPTAVWLAGAPPDDVAWDVDGKWIDNAGFTDEDIVAGNGCGDTLDDLIETMRDGGTYVNVHSRMNPGGEVRGQIRARNNRPNKNY